MNQNNDQKYLAYGLRQRLKRLSSKQHDMDRGFFLVNVVKLCKWIGEAENGN